MLTPILIPDDLQSQMEEAAEAEGKTVSQLMQEAAVRYLNHRALDRLASRGQKYAAAKGIQPSDIPALIADLRRE